MMLKDRDHKGCIRQYQHPTNRSTLSCAGDGGGVLGAGHDDPAAGPRQHHLRHQRPVQSLLPLLPVQVQGHI